MGIACGSNTYVTRILLAMKPKPCIAQFFCRHHPVLYRMRTDLTRRRENQYIAHNGRDFSPHNKILQGKHRPKKALQWQCNHCNSFFRGIHKRRKSDRTLIQSFFILLLCFA
jgi:hypothetical protein